MLGLDKRTAHAVRSRRVRFVSSALALTLASCGPGPLEVNGAPSHAISVKTGRELELTLQTIGPGEYASPPALSSSVVRFRDVRLVTPAVPAGITQRFRFLAASPGQAIIVFQPTQQGPTVEDTVNVH